MSNELTLRYGNQSVTVQRKIRASSRSSIQITVHPEGRVVAAIPADQCEHKVQEALNKRASWVFRQLNDFKRQQAHSLPRSYVGGESHLYLGRRYVLKVITIDRKGRSSVKLLRGHLEVRTHYKAKAKIKGLLDDWYRERAKDYFAKRLEVVSEQALWLKAPPQLRIRVMTKQWGNCSSSGTLTLNTHLIKAPRECIDYVIQHELCHFLEHNHSPKFYRILKQLAPEWEITKQRLDKLASSIL